MITKKKWKKGTHPNPNPHTLIIINHKRDDLIAKYNKIKKKYTEDMLPKLDTIVHLLDGSPAILKNQ